MIAPIDLDTKKSDVAYGMMMSRRYFSETTGNERKCWVYLPPGMAVETSYPVVYLLHGIGGTHSEWLNGSPNEIISNLIHEGSIPPVIGVFPNIRASYDDSVPNELFTQEHFDACDNFIHDLTRDLMPFIEANYPVSKERRDTAIGGLSMGGREALYIGFQCPGRFGAIGAFSPAPGLLPTIDQEGRTHRGQISAHEMKLPGDTKVVVCNGTEEEMFDDVAKNYLKAMEPNGVKYFYFITSGGHDFRVWKMGLVEFLKKAFKI